jgi:hypothetical protein
MPLINYIGNRQEALGKGAGGFVRGAAPPPPSLSVEYLIVGGGVGCTNGTGGAAGGVISGSLSIPFRTTITMNVGSGGFDLGNAQSSSLSGSGLGFVSTSVVVFGGNSGNNFSNGLTGPNLTQGGGAGSSKNGNNGVVGQNGDGGSGSVWVNGQWYGGGGGGIGGSPPANPGYPGIGGGGTAQVGFGPDGLPYQTAGVNGRGGGAAGGDPKGGDGIIIIRYSTASVVPPYDNAIAGGTLEISGGYAYRTFTTGSSQLIYSY